MKDLQASPAEMVFGMSLRIPGEFIDPKPLPTVTFQDFVTELRRLFNAIRPAPTSRYREPFVFKDLASTKYVFRRIDSVKKPFEQPHSGPHRVTERINDLDYVVDVNGNIKTLSTDQLKPAYIAPGDLAHLAATSSQASQAIKPPSTTA